MGKFLSKEVTKNGNPQRVWIPQNRESFMEPVVDEAVACGAIKNEDGSIMTIEQLRTLRDEIKLTLRAAEIAALKKRKPY